jgi:hypothetical protein
MPFEITCPYCFLKFQDDQVVFRAKHAFTIDDISNSFLSDAEREKRMSFLQFSEYDGDLGSLDAGQVVDGGLAEFWKKRGGSAGYQTDDPEWYYPHIDPADTVPFYKMTRSEPIGDVVPGDDRFVRDEDGFVRRVIDVYEHVATDDMVRLCPRCHNRLPLPDYGKYRTVFIGVTGMTGSGKTVYLTQLLSGMSRWMQNSGYHVAATGALSGGLLAGKELPSSTDPLVMRRPKAINLFPDDAGKSPYTLVFYDIAGENCVDSVDDSQEDREVKTAIASYIGHVDALLFLVDPAQIPVFSAQGENIRVGELVNRVCDLRSGPWDQVPVAVVLTKSDQPGIAETLGRALEMEGGLRPVPENDADGNPYRGFARAEFVDVNTHLHRLFTSQIRDVESELARFRKRGYFAVSAISQGIVDRVEMHASVYHLSPDDAESLRRTKEWMREWDARAEGDRLYISGRRLENNAGVICPHTCKDDGSEIAFEIPCRSDAYSDVVTRIQVTRGDQYPINLTLGDIRGLTLQSVPLGGGSLRIEEPLKWMLWRLGVISEPRPHFDDGPVYPPFCSRKKKLFIDEQWEEQRRILTDQYYACEEVLEA